MTLDYLARFGAHLRELKAAVSARLAGAGSDREVDARLDRVTAEWQRRQEATGGRLDGELGAGATATARRMFQVRGLDAPDARRAEGETLTFYAGAVGARPATVYLAPNMSPREMAHRLNVGLAPLGVDCAVDAQGGVRFSVQESKWDSVERSLRIKGSGVRFPSGQPQRPTRVDIPNAIDPSHWKTDDREALRNSLQQIVQALAQVDSAVARVRRALKDTRQALGRIAPDVGPQWAHAVSEKVVEPGGGFRAAGSLVTAAAGLDVTRVRALLLRR
ncbi:hypothetical protein WT59_21900 [Burkholderia territorii]|nr:hypothetical protein WT59_21900 [Burkholderia territorii]